MIKNRSELQVRKREIDLSGPEGNVFALMGIGAMFAKILNREGITKDWSKIQNDMMSSDYDNAVNVMEREFGDFIIMYR